MTKKQRYEGIIRYFLDHNPNAQTELIYHTPFELLVAVILSAQCTEIYEYIKSVSYPNNKAHHLLAASQRIVSEYGGEVPSDYDALLSLPGVGRKTANVMVSVLWNEPRMAVDTHVFRVSNRIGLTLNSKTPYETEMELTRNIPEKYIPQAHHWLILHGRYVCTARNPKCKDCGISEFCKYYAAKMKDSDGK